MADSRPHMRLARLPLLNRPQFVTVPVGSVCLYAEVDRHHLATVWQCPGREVAPVTVRLVFIPVGEAESAEFSPQFRHVITCPDLRGGYISLLQLEE